MLKNIFGHLGSLWRRIERIGTDERTVLVVTALPSLQLSLRILAIQERWHILFAKTLDTALQISKLNRVTVVLCDRELADADWRAAAREIIAGNTPVFFILLSSELDRPVWKAVLDNGGYDVARRNVDSEKLGRLVNGAFALASSIDAVAASVPTRVLNA